MLYISAAEMREMDSYAIEKVGIPSIVLMESAALKVVEEIDLEHTNSYTIICANGNNGGDGLAVARRLILANKKVDLFILADPKKGSKDFKVNLTILENMGLHYSLFNEKNFLIDMKNSLLANDLTIDAILGIGLDREVKGIFKQVIKNINRYSKQTLAVDTPSGLDADSGKVLGVAIQADRTISFHLMKKGLSKSKKHSGEVTVVDIGIPDFVTQMVLEN